LNPALLIIIAPVQMKDELLELLQEHPELASGFTVTSAEGHGADLAFRTLTDQVRGREDRIRVECVLERTKLPALREAIKQRLSGSNIVCWTVPVMEFGKC
jgi:hypothetical protein